MAEELNLVTDSLYFIHIHNATLGPVFLGIARCLHLTPKESTWKLHTANNNYRGTSTEACTEDRYITPGTFGRMHRFLISPGKKIVGKGLGNRKIFNFAAERNFSKSTVQFLFVCAFFILSVIKRR